MLAHHLDQDTHLASRPIAAIEEMVGCLVMDVVAVSAFAGIREQLTLEENLMSGFWSDSDYVGIHRTWLFPGETLSLDHYVIIEPTGNWEILNWMQFFSSGQLTRELEEAGFGVRALARSLAGGALKKDSGEIGVIAEIDSERG